ncbi:lantibiotic dehydratase [Streptomyces niveus]
MNEIHGGLDVDELAVTTNSTHLYLWSTRHRRPVVPVLYNRLTPRHLPPAAYLLHLLGQAGRARGIRGAGLGVQLARRREEFEQSCLLAGSEALDTAVFGDAQFAE